MVEDANAARLRKTCFVIGQPAPLFRALQVSAGAAAARAIVARLDDGGAECRW